MMKKGMLFKKYFGSLGRYFSKKRFFFGGGQLLENKNTLRGVLGVGT